MDIFPCILKDLLSTLKYNVEYIRSFICNKNDIKPQY